MSWFEIFNPQACFFDWNKSQLRESLLETRPTFTRRSPWLSSVYPRFCYRKVPKPLRTLLKAIHQLKKHDGIVITNPCKGSGVVVMDKEEYLRLLAEASINDATEFRLVDPERPTSRGRPLQALSSSSLERKRVRVNPSPNSAHSSCRFCPSIRL